MQSSQKHFQTEPFEKARAVFEFPPTQVCPSAETVVESVTWAIAPGRLEAAGSAPTVVAPKVSLW